MRRMATVSIILQTFLLLPACSDADWDPGDPNGEIVQSVISPNPCTDTAVVVPSSPFGITMGSMIPLSATAVCPPGQTPVFQFWVKQQTDPNWIALNPFSSGPFSWVPPIAGNWCVSVVARSTDQDTGYQARSGAICGKVTGTPQELDPQFVTYGVGLTTASVPGFGDNGPLQNVPPTHWNFINAGTTGPTAGKVYYPIELPTGHRLLSWSIAINKQTSNAHTMTAKLFRTRGALFLSLPVGVTQTNAANRPGITTIGQAGLSEVVKGEQYWVELGSPGSSTANGVDVAAELTISYVP